MALRSPYTSPSVRSPDFPFVRRLSNTSPTAGANNWFVRSLAVGTGDGRTWLNAFTTLAAALTAGAAGDKFWVSEDHAETTAGSVTLTSPGTAVSPCQIICVNHFGTVPPVSADLRTTAIIAVTGAVSLTCAGLAYCYGIGFSSGSAANNATIAMTSAWWSFKICSFTLNTSNNASNIVIGGAIALSRISWDNCTITMGAVGQNIQHRGSYFEWKNTASAIGGASVPDNLFGASNSNGGNILVEGVDLSAAGSGKTLIAAMSAPARFVFKDCKLGASVTVAATPTSPGAAETTVVRSDSSGTNYRAEKYQYMGTQSVETTTVRTGGASDGTTPLSWKIVTTANSKWVLPFEALPIAIWNDTTGSLVTVTIEGIWGSTNLPQTDDIWFEIEGLGSAASPQGSFGSGSKADNLANGTVWATSSEVWGAGSTTAFKMTATFTPQQKGALYIYVKAAKASTTFYIDPKVTLS
jgi:hypothetical protein